MTVLSIIWLGTILLFTLAFGFSSIYLMLKKVPEKEEQLEGRGGGN